jgi:hypothetical protein
VAARRTDVREGFLVTPPRSFIWSSVGRHWIDGVEVSAQVFDLAVDGDLAGARGAWLTEQR